MHALSGYFSHSFFIKTQPLRSSDGHLNPKWIMRSVFDYSSIKDCGKLGLFCRGCSQCDTGSEAYFGNGTKLTVLGKSELLQLFCIAINDKLHSCVVENEGVTVS